MFKNYLMVALRHLQRHKVYTVINVSGLSGGLLCDESVVAGFRISD